MQLTLPIDPVSFLGTISMKLFFGFVVTVSIRIMINMVKGVIRINIIRIIIIVILDLDEDHLGVDATERSRGGALDGGVDGDGGQIPVWGGGEICFLI